MAESRTSLSILVSMRLPWRSYKIIRRVQFGFLLFVTLVWVALIIWLLSW